MVLFLLVSPEAVGFLSAVGVLIILLLILFLYINKKMCFENIGGLPDLNSHYSSQKNSQDKLRKYKILQHMILKDVENF